jgi:hypothetical protein
VAPCKHGRCGAYLPNMHPHTDQAHLVEIPPSEWGEEAKAAAYQPAHLEFIAFMNRIAGPGSYAPIFHNHFWRVRGVLVTLWFGDYVPQYQWPVRFLAGNLSIYHDQGPRIWREVHQVGTEASRKAVLRLVNGGAG